MTAAVAAVSWRALIQPGLHDRRLGAAARLVLVGQPLVDAVLLGFAARLVLPRAARDRASVALAPALSLLAGADLAFRLRGRRGELPAGLGRRLDLAGRLRADRPRGDRALERAPARRLPRRRAAPARVVLLAVFVPELVLRGTSSGATCSG